MRANFIIGKFSYLLGVSLCFIKISLCQDIVSEPVFQVNYTGNSSLKTPTADKPQSKLFYMDSKWWALLPNNEGPSLWERKKDGHWQEVKEIRKEFKGIPGRADVWYENNVATAVTVGDSSLFILRLSARRKGKKWGGEILNQLRIPSGGKKMETATIVRDHTGTWWVTADDGGTRIYAWASKDGKSWSEPILIGEGIDPDDISCVSVIPNGVVIIWSNQVKEAVYSRVHKNGDELTHWSSVAIVESGDRTADDHINTALTSDGTLWVATKNSVDKVNEPNFVLRVRKPDGVWRNFPFLDLEKDMMPSRPVIISTEEDKLLLGYSFYDFKNKKNGNRIIFGLVDTTSNKILITPKIVIEPDKKLNSSINNITGPKSPFSRKGPWIILASDQKGNIYEADLKQLFY